MTVPASAARTDHGRLLSHTPKRVTPASEWVPGLLPAGRSVTKCPDFGSGSSCLFVDRIVRVYGFAPITSVASRALHATTRATSKPGRPVGGGPGENRTRVRSAATALHRAIPDANDDNHGDRAPTRTMVAAVDGPRFNGTVRARGTLGPGASMSFGYSTPHGVTGIEGSAQWSLRRGFRN